MDQPSLETSTGLDPRLSGLLCYILGPITGVIFLLVEKRNEVVRFHAAQSLALSVALIVLNVALGLINSMLFVASIALGGALSMLFSLVYVAELSIWLFMLYKGYSGERYKLPVLGDLAESITDRIA